MVSSIFESICVLLEVSRGVEVYVFRFLGKPKMSVASFLSKQEYIYSELVSGCRARHVSLSLLQTFSFPVEWSTSSHLPTHLCELLQVVGSQWIEFWPLAHWRLCRCEQLQRRSTSVRYCAPRAAALLKLKVCRAETFKMKSYCFH